MRTLKVMMAYCGTRYHGYQRQNNANTVQAVVEAAVSKLLNTPTVIAGCSRTDTGVHAEQFCFSLTTENPIPCRNFVRGLNGYLPEDISILSCEEVKNTFHARFCCQAKTYRYWIHNSESKNPFAADRALHYRRALRIDQMQAAADLLKGTHDFASFCSGCTENKDTVRTIYQFDIKMQGTDCFILVKGNGFLYNMIRILVGTLLSVSEGELSMSEIPEILAARNRIYAGRTVQPYGLYLHEIFYDDAAYRLPQGDAFFGSAVSGGERNGK